MKVVQGDLIKMAKDGEFSLIAHGCNCFHTMGSGIAQTVKKEFPEAFIADQGTLHGDKNKLGSCSYCMIPEFVSTVRHTPLLVVNAYTQYSFGGDEVHVDYDAVRSCMKWLKLNYPHQIIGLPKIGAGLGGGDWDLISKIIDEELVGEDVTLVEFVQ